MKNAEKLKNHMQPGLVYRRQDLALYSTAVDRDLNTLVADGEAVKLAGGLYYRPATNAFGLTPPEERELVRPFSRQMISCLLLTITSISSVWGLRRYIAPLWSIIIKGPGNFCWVGKGSNSAWCPLIRPD